MTILPLKSLEMLKPRSFDEFLQYTFIEDEPESVGTKDDFEDNFSKWLEEQDTNDIIEWADMYARWYAVSL